MKDRVTTDTVDQDAKCAWFAARMQELQREELGNEYRESNYSRQTVYKYMKKVGIS